jgi:Fe-S cluster biogenesis protein NfuA/nitrite reductase/ring-hydroxylating ferredoxin subunit
VTTHPPHTTTESVHAAELLDRVQQLSERVDQLSDEHARELCQELVSSVIAMYGDGLSRIMDAIADSREAGATILDQLSQDGSVASLLLIHDLYPVPLRDRVIEALDTVRPYMESHGGNVELVSLQDGVARLALQGSCHGCAASRATLETAIEQALAEHAPDLAGLEVSGVVEEPAMPGMGLPMAGDGGRTDNGVGVGVGVGVGGGFELPVVHAGPADGEPTPDRRNGRAAWVALDDGARPEAGTVRELAVDGTPLLLADVDGSLLAYVNECASCGGPLGAAQLSGGLLHCPACSVEFDLPHAGRAAGGEPLQLRPVPLLSDGGLRVAV